MLRVKSILLAAVTLLPAVGQSHAQEPPATAKQPTFVERLVLNPSESCTTGAPAPGDVVALALRGAKGANYMFAGRNEEARLAVRGPATTAYSVFQITETATENAVAMYNLGHAKFLKIDAETRVSATAEPPTAVPFVFEETGDGYLRIKLRGQPLFMRMNQNGYLDFRTRNAETAVQFCAQDVVAE